MTTELNGFPKLKKKIKTHFDAVNLTPPQTQALKARLLAESSSSAAESPPSAVLPSASLLRPSVSAGRRGWVPLVLVGACACALGFILGSQGPRLARLGFMPDFVDADAGGPSFFDPLADVNSLVARSMPADFDLEGDLAALPDIIREVLPGEPFLTSVPSHLVSEYDAKDGRFFLWSGMPGVRVNVHPKVKEAPPGVPSVAGSLEPPFPLTQAPWAGSVQGVPAAPSVTGAVAQLPAGFLGSALDSGVASAPLVGRNTLPVNNKSTLYIFKLPEGKKRRLMAQSQIHKFAGAQNDKKIKFWSDDQFGYTLVSPLAVAVPPGVESQGLWGR